jgi:hypothetical protein
MYWGIIDQRLRKHTVFSSRQKGFVAEPGCYNNIQAVAEVLRAAKAHKGIVMIQLDISKAFDSIPHQAVDPALRRLGVPPHLRSSIVNSYRHVSTDILYGGSTTHIDIRRGVKQGDPLSPYIFNAIMDPLLDQLEDLRGYAIDSTHSISSVAFADDMLLLADDQDSAQNLLTHTEVYLQNLGMTIAPSKCVSFQIVAAKDSWYVKDTELYLLHGDRIPSSTADTATRYLGGYITPWFGLGHKHIVDLMEQTLHRLRGASLKPHQKLNLLTTYLIPHFLHATVLAIPPITTIRDMDSLIRVHVKDVLHLPASTPNGLIYCGKRDGGLGVPKLEVLSVSTALKLGMTLLETADADLKAILNITRFEARLERLAKSARIHWPISHIKYVDAYKRHQKKLDLQKWSSLPIKGKSVSSFADDRYGNCWLYDPTLLKPSRFLTALRLRSGTAGDRVTLNKAIPMATIKCRKCHDGNETLAHILGQCTFTKASRIRRHNEIRDFIAKKLATSNSGFQVIEEAAVDTPSGTLKPDLVVVHQGRVHVVDVTVRHEDTGYLEGGHTSKTTKYTPLLPLLAERLRKEPGEVLPVVIGTRGAIPKSTISSLTALNLYDRSTCITLALLALRSSIELYHAFIDYDACPRRRPTIPWNPP